jgi:hypothetical protein
VSGVKKRFDRNLYKLYDELAKDATRLYNKKLGKSVSDNTNRYRQDLVCDDYLLECEVKLVWEGDEFPYENVQLPQRKQKFFDSPTQFYIWNKSLTRAATFWSEEIKDLSPVEVPNKYVYKGEYFFQIPLDRVTFVSLEHNLELPQ